MSDSRINSIAQALRDAIAALPNDAKSNAVRQRFQELIVELNSRQIVAGGHWGVN
jgi:hypothetical protein